jgi:hypothetical protein
LQEDQDALADPYDVFFREATLPKYGLFMGPLLSDVRAPIPRAIPPDRSHGRVSPRSPAERAAATRRQAEKWTGPLHALAQSDRGLVCALSCGLYI